LNALRTIGADESIVTFDTLNTLRSLRSRRTSSNSNSGSITSSYATDCGSAVLFYINFH
jgi:hypothetical protein